MPSGIYAGDEVRMAADIDGLKKGQLVMVVVSDRTNGWCIVVTDQGLRRKVSMGYLKML